jgi:hypothetical protein
MVVPITIIAEKFAFQIDKGTGLVALVGEGGIANNAVDFQMLSHILLTPEAARNLLLNLDSLRVLLEQTSVTPAKPSSML